MLGELRSQLDAFDSMLVDLARENERIVVLSADMGTRIVPRFINAYPSRFFNFGMGEQCMVGAAAGLALCGLIPYVTTLSCFLSMRSCEQIRTDIAYPYLNVKIVGTGGGLSYGTLGATHQALEDIGLMRCIANLTVMAPADATETAHAIIAASAHRGPVYIRLARGKVPNIYPAEFRGDFEIGKAIKLREGSDIAFIATGIMVAKALEASLRLEESYGINASVFSMHTVKPLDEEAIMEAAKATYGIVTLEDHTIKGGLGEAIAAVLATRRPTRVKIIGIPDIYPVIGEPEELYSEYRMSTSHIMEAALEAVGFHKRASRDYSTA